MNFMKKAWEHLDKPLWLASILIGLVLTLVVDKLPFLTRVVMVEIVLILINGIFSIWSGYWIYKHQRKWGELFIFPILYLITAYFFMPRYTYYFALAYLALAYLSWAMRQQK
ncbi:hypothetical protein HF82_00730 [Limosilactobacillus reuteri]|uniref:Uncharacterized protein n=1 Tax=Limosilactobacillus reuteri TaxID=1598 RepID=A0A073JYW2_LIMRT|nr:hypothetical protein [Limosilactobacillus reuteri]MCW3763881.1 hypothetical protein [Weissella confusa]KEK13839.1 hypothetical protein LR3_09460 [Limosilactobacillus reuteri]KEK15863.1 hypothetical protein HQ33_02005 [Limosilactobacillus reuteri]KEQ20487.1 hypothetical protein HF82_00730 [Limosilactobacillus reuteri]MCT3198564.1 hypothetical protein [Limosilactobacillus reuteri]